MPRATVVREEGKICPLIEQQADYLGEREVDGSPSLGQAVIRQLVARLTR